MTRVTEAGAAREFIMRRAGRRLCEPSSGVPENAIDRRKWAWIACFWALNMYFSLGVK
ncbi:hypothetical protein [Burkholderia sp. ABCPW 111]|uniref:hypothetical protein n=1 Tax=Burkholderia sp. ABCPW 111 TaxID=1820025 RepID=UPI000531ADDC|nr:hypothetical protein [Burkholderia sp. ABCPW 111]KGS03423.1 hypothetical protein X946_3132 [Burkholderia sp. ABCPW 111]